MGNKNKEHRGYESRKLPKDRFWQPLLYVDVLALRRSFRLICSNRIPLDPVVTISAQYVVAV